MSFQTYCNYQLLACKSAQTNIQEQLKMTLYLFMLCQLGLSACRLIPKSYSADFPQTSNECDVFACLRNKRHLLQRKTILTMPISALQQQPLHITQEETLLL